MSSWGVQRTLASIQYWGYSMPALPFSRHHEPTPTCLDAGASRPSSRVPVVAYVCIMFAKVCQCGYMWLRGCTSFYVAGHKSVQVRLGLELEIPKKMATHLTTPFQYFMYFPFGCIEANISKCKVSCQGGRKLISGRFGDPCAPCMP